VDFDIAAVCDQVASLNPSARFLVTSARTGEGMDTWIAHLEEALARKRAEAPVPAGARV